MRGSRRFHSGDEIVGIQVWNGFVIEEISVDSPWVTRVVCTPRSVVAFFVHLDSRSQDEGHEAGLWRHERRLVFEG